MKISGFSFVRNGVKLYYPVVEAIKSILPICDEFIIAIGKGDEDDNTRELVAAIDDPKIRIIDTEWEEKYFKKGVINGIQTNVARKECTGDWLFYVQADEVVHEKYLPVIKKRCEELLDNEEVEGLLFRYKHFWGDYNHYHKSHAWYPDEIRIIRNRPDILSWESAQSFRSYEYYDNPRQPDGTRKLSVAWVNAEIYHYGWVRPPHLMQNKSRAFNILHWGRKKAEDYYDKAPKEFDYGPLDKIPVFKDTHPSVMQDMIARFDWEDKLQKTGKPNPNRELFKHEKPIVKLHSWIEQNILGGKTLWGFHNYNLIKNI